MPRGLVLFCTQQLQCLNEQVVMANSNQVTNFLSWIEELLCVGLHYSAWCCYQTQEVFTIATCKVLFKLALSMQVYMHSAMFYTNTALYIYNNGYIMHSTGSATAHRKADNLWETKQSQRHHIARYYESAQEDTCLASPSGIQPYHTPGKEDDS